MCLPICCVYRTTRASLIRRTLVIFNHYDPLLAIPHQVQSRINASRFFSSSTTGATIELRVGRVLSQMYHQTPWGQRPPILPRAGWRCHFGETVSCLPPSSAAGPGSKKPVTALRDQGRVILQSSISCPSHGV